MNSTLKTFTIAAQSICAQAGTKASGWLLLKPWSAESLVRRKMPNDARV